MRVLHLTRDFPPDGAGGISTAAAGMVAALRDGGVPAAVISFDHWRRREQGAPLVVEPGGDEVALRIRRGAPLAAIESSARRFCPDVVHLHHENLWSFADALRSTLGCPIVYTTHVLHDGDGGASGGEQRIALRYADLIAAPSRSAAAEIAAVGVATPIHVVPNVVAAGAPGVRDGAPLGLFAGRFDHAKGIDTLFDVMDAALRAHPELRFAIAGGLPASGKRERRWPRRWHERADPAHAGRVQFHGWLDRGALSALYARAHVQIVPSRRETFGLSAAEGMAHGLPIVATRAGALPEIIEDGATGFLCAPGDAAAIAERVLALVRDPDRAAQMGALGAAIVAQRFSAAAVRPQLVAAYEAALTSRAGNCKSE